MKKAFILLMCLFTLLTVNLNTNAQDFNISKASMDGNVIRSQFSFINDGNWNDGDNWNIGEVPVPGSDVVIIANAVIPAGYTAVANEISLVGGSITVADGGQLRHNTEGLLVTMKKNIEPYCVVNGTDNYYLLAFPFSVDVAVPNAMTVIEGYDFYKFDGDCLEAEWRNNKQETIATISGTTGYLYANSEAIELSLTGSTYPSYNEEVIPVTVPYIEGSTNPSNGWALLGNPFTCNAYVYCYNSDNELVPMDYMVYDANGELLTSSGGPIAPMQGFFVNVTEPTTVYIKNYAVLIGAINGKFTINEDGDQIHFSQGNLQYQASTNTWKFADNQYDYIGYANSNISSSYDGWIDLFGWGTSGYHDTNDPYNVNYQPWSSSDSLLDNDYNNYGYGPSTNMPDMNLTGTSANYDWGVNNPISNGGNIANRWRTLTWTEWNYVLDTRNTPSGIRFAKAQVNDVNGVILLPDDWTSDTYNLNNTNSIGAYYSSNVINASQWATIENVGGVFLPAAGGRFGTTVADVGSTGFYWLSSSYSSCCAYYVLLYNAGIYIVNYNRYLGRSVRLVSDVE